MYFRTKEQMEQSQYVVDVMHCRVEQRFSDGRIVVLAQGPSAGKYVSPALLALMRRR